MNTKLSSGSFCTTVSILLAWAEPLWCNRKESQALWKFILKFGLKYYRAAKIQFFQQLLDPFRNLYCFFAWNEGLGACWISTGLPKSSPNHCPSRAAICAQMPQAVWEGKRSCHWNLRSAVLEGKSQMKYVISRSSNWVCFPCNYFITSTLRAKPKKKLKHHN